MVRPARLYEDISQSRRVGATQAAEFWAAVEDCLVEFHKMSRGDAAKKVTDFWRRLANLSPRPTNDRDFQEASYQFDDMIYHAQPWYIACNLAEEELPIEPNKRAYEEILRQNHLT